MKLQNAVGAVGRQIEGLTGKVGIIVTKYRERRDGLSQLANSIQQEIGQVGREAVDSAVRTSLQEVLRVLPTRLPASDRRGEVHATSGREICISQSTYSTTHCAVGLPEFAL